MLRKGVEVQVTKRGKPIARLTPEPTARPPLPDFLGRLQEIYGDKTFEVSGADLISADREERF